MKALWLAFLLLFGSQAFGGCLTRGTGDMGIVIERATGSLKIWIPARTRRWSA